MSERCPTCGGSGIKRASLLDNQGHEVLRTYGVCDDPWHDAADADGIAAGLKAAAEGRTKPLERVRREAADGKAGGTTDEQEHQRAGSLRTAPARQPSDPADALREKLEQLEYRIIDYGIARANFADRMMDGVGLKHARERAHAAARSLARAAAEWALDHTIGHGYPRPAMRAALNRILDGRDDDDDEFWPCGHQKAGEPHDCR